MEFGANMRRLAGMHLVSQVELAELTGMSRQGLNNIAIGKSTPNLGTATRIADLFGVSVGDLQASPEHCVMAGARAYADAPIRSSILGEVERETLVVPKTDPVPRRAPKDAKTAARQRA